MKELKNILNTATDHVFKFLEKTADAIKDDKKSILIKLIIKLSLLVLVYLVCGLITEGIIELGTYIIYLVGTSARALLSSVWSVIVKFMYFLFILVSLYRLTSMAEKDNNFISIFKNKKKDKETKERIFVTVEIIIKIFRTIILIPLFVLVIGLLFAFGVMVGYVKEGMYLYSLFVIDLGLVSVFTALILLIKEFLTPGDKMVKRCLTTIIISSIVVVLGSVGLLVETKDYKINKSLTTDFKTSQIKYEYKINNKKDYVIYHDGRDANLELVIDDDLGSYLEIVITHTNTNIVNATLKEENNKVKIRYDEDLNIRMSDVENIYNLALTCMKEKTIYNYTLLKYATIEVRVSSDYADNIKFVNEKGKEYSPYEDINK